MANPNPKNQFQKGNKAASSSRRRFSENALFSKAQEYTEEMLDILANEARTAKESSSRIRAADRLLSHVIVSQNDEVEATTIQIPMPELKNLLLESFQNKSLKEQQQCLDDLKERKESFLQDAEQADFE